MKVFDFDNTLYFGESCVDLAMFMIAGNKKIILWLPKIFLNLIRYKLCLISREEIEYLINDFMQKIIRDKDELLKLTEKFWKKYKSRLNTELLRSVTKDDVIISAGPRFLLEAVSEQTGTSNLICSEVDLDARKITFLNFSENKVRAFKSRYGDAVPECFYTDSYNDRAMMDISESVYLIKKHRIKKIK